jgi:hypothetical protein
MRPASASMYSSRSAVGWVHQIGPVKPSRDKARQQA